MVNMLDRVGSFPVCNTLNIPKGLMLHSSERESQNCIGMLTVGR